MRVMAKEPNLGGEMHGLAAGWTKHTIQIPEGLKRDYVAELKKRGHSGGKIVGSVSTALFLGLPDDVRLLMHLWGIQQTFDDPNRLTPGATQEAFARICKLCAEQRIREAKGAGGEPIEGNQIDRFLTMILDPDFDWGKAKNPVPATPLPTTPGAGKKNAS